MLMKTINNFVKIDWFSFAERGGKYASDKNQTHNNNETTTNNDSNNNVWNGNNYIRAWAISKWIRKKTNWKQSNLQ